MTEQNVRRDASLVLNRDSVQFNANLRYVDQTAWPFWYSSIPTPYQETDSLNNGLGLLGHRVAAGTIKDIPIQLERDTVFRLINFKYTIFRECVGSQLDAGAGDISIAAGGTAVVGVGTTFTNLSVGDPLIWVDDSGFYQVGVIATIAGNLALTVEEPVTNSATNVPYFRAMYCAHDTVPNKQTAAIADLTGTITIAAGGTAVVGVGTLFLGELSVGDVIQVEDAAGILRNFMIATITNNTNATITETLSATVGVPAGSTFKLIGNVLPSGGTVTVTAANNLITGAATDFVTDITQGDVLFYPDAAGVVQAVRADSITSITQAKFTQPATASGAGVNMAIGVSNAAVSPVPTNLFRYRPLTDFVRVTVSFPSLRGRYLYGGLQHIPNLGFNERPHLISTLQGIDDGAGMLRTPALLPYDGALVIRVHNNYTQDILINPTAFGYKIALDTKEAEVV